jgi:NAD(P)-dependent dehydrogenase (short-subunit alcohol dehydrogenase family)
MAALLSVIITGRDASRLGATAKETGARPVTCDGADPRQVMRLADEVGTGLDVLVNMAGGNGRISSTAG